MSSPSARCFLIVVGSLPKVRPVILPSPSRCLGGGVIVMFGMVVGAGMSMLSDVDWNRLQYGDLRHRRSRSAWGLAAGAGCGLQHLPGPRPRFSLTSGLLPGPLLDSCC